MGQLERSIELYRLMAQRCDKSGFEPNQAKVYQEMTEFIADCSNIEDATASIKNSKYYLAPTEALVRDTIQAKIKAALEKDMPDVAEVYENKLKAIDTDQGEMYTSGYEQTALNIRKDYILTLQAFGEIFRAYFCYRATGKDTYIGEINKNLGQLKRPSQDFFELAKIKTFRELLTCTDKGYEEFVKDMKTFTSGGQESLAPKISGEDSETAWESIKDLKSQVKEAGKNFVEYSPKPEVTVTGTKEGYR